MMYLNLFNFDLLFHFFNESPFSVLLIRFFLNLVVGVIITKNLQRFSSNRKQYQFTYIVISSTIFLLCYLLETVKIELGFALGLFAIFGIIRYRTDAIPVKEMSYLFVIIGLAISNALANGHLTFFELITLNIIMIALVTLLERNNTSIKEAEKKIIYEKIDLIKPSNKNELLADLKNRTGLDIHHVQIGRINFLNDTAELTIYYKQD